ncbi:hypothetical protein RI367_008342 [Sorochytrium milnesiophthora]
MDGFFPIWIALIMVVMVLSVCYRLQQRNAIRNTTVVMSPPPGVAVSNGTQLPTLNGVQIVQPPGTFQPQQPYVVQPAMPLGQDQQQQQIYHQPSMQQQQQALAHFQAQQQMQLQLHQEHPTAPVQPIVLPPAYQASLSSQVPLTPNLEQSTKN